MMMMTMTMKIMIRIKYVLVTPSICLSFLPAQFSTCPTVTSLFLLLIEWPWLQALPPWTFLSALTLSLKAESRAIPRHCSAPCFRSMCTVTSSLLLLRDIPNSIMPRGCQFTGTFCAPPPFNFSACFPLRITEFLRWWAHLLCPQTRFSGSHCFSFVSLIPERKRSPWWGIVSS